MLFPSLCICFFSLAIAQSDEDLQRASLYFDQKFESVRDLFEAGYAAAQKVDLSLVKNSFVITQDAGNFPFEIGAEVNGVEGNLNGLTALKEVFLSMLVETLQQAPTTTEAFTQPSATPPSNLPTDALLKEIKEVKKMLSQQRIRVPQFRFDCPSLTDLMCSNDVTTDTPSTTAATIELGDASHTASQVQLFLIFYMLKSVL